MPNDAALAAVNSRLDNITAALRLMIATQATHGEILAKIFEAACPSEEGGELEDAMRRVASALRDQTTVLERVEAELSGLGAEVEAGVVRGLSQALGVDGADDEDDALAEGEARSREGEGAELPKDGAEPAGLAGGC
jgi:uncharacterized protein (DUF697 family)